MCKSSQLFVSNCSNCIHSNVCLTLKSYLQPCCLTLPIGLCSTLFRNDVQLRTAIPFILVISPTLWPYTMQVALGLLTIAHHRTQTWSPPASPSASHCESGRQSYRPNGRGHQWFLGERQRERERQRDKERERKRSISIYQYHLVGTHQGYVQLYNAIFAIISHFLNSQIV